jgi:hypothetical protein
MVLALDVLLQLLRMLAAEVDVGLVHSVLEDAHEGAEEVVDVGVDALLAGDGGDAQYAAVLSIVRLRDWRRGVFSGRRAREANGIFGRSNAMNVLRSGVLRLTVHVCISVCIMDWSRMISPSAAISENILEK